MMRLKVGIKMLGVEIVIDKLVRYVSIMILGMRVYVLRSGKYFSRLKVINECRERYGKSYRG